MGVPLLKEGDDVPATATGMFHLVLTDKILPAFNPVKPFTTCRLVACDMSVKNK
jgi:hypothetical protein